MGGGREGVILALQSSDAVHVGVDNLGVVRHVGRLLNGGYCSPSFELVSGGDLLVLIRRMLDLRGRDTVQITKVKGHAHEGMVLDGRVRELDRLGNNAADEAADFGRRRVGPPVIDARRNLSGFGVDGILLFLIFIGSSLPFLEPLLTMMETMVLPLILWCGLLVLCRRGVGWFLLSVTWLCCLDLLLFGLVNGLLVLLSLLVLMMLVSGPTLLVFWLNGVRFSVHCIGALGVWTLVLVVFPLLSCSFFMSFGLVRG